MVEQEKRWGYSPLTKDVPKQIILTEISALRLQFIPIKNISISFCTILVIKKLRKMNTILFASLLAFDYQVQVKTRTIKLFLILNYHFFCVNLNPFAPRKFFDFERFFVSKQSISFL